MSAMSLEIVEVAIDGLLVSAGVDETLSEEGTFACTVSTRGVEGSAGLISSRLSAARLVDDFETVKEMPEREAASELEPIWSGWMQSAEGTRINDAGRESLLSLSLPRDILRNRTAEILRDNRLDLLDAASTPDDRERDDRVLADEQTGSGSGSGSGGSGSGSLMMNSISRMPEKMSN